LNVTKHLTEKCCPKLEIGLEYKGLENATIKSKIDMDRNLSVAYKTT